MERRVASVALVVGAVHLDAGPLVVGAQGTGQQRVQVTSAVDGMTSALYLNLTAVDLAEEADGEPKPLSALLTFPAALASGAGRALGESGWQAEAVAGRAAWCAAALAGAALCDALSQGARLPVPLPIGAPWRRDAPAVEAQALPEVGEAASQEAGPPEGEAQRIEEAEEERGRGEEEAAPFGPSASRALPWMTAAAVCWRLVCRRMKRSAVARQAAGCAVSLVGLQIEEGFEKLRDEETPHRSARERLESDEMEVDLIDTPKGKSARRAPRSSGVVHQRAAEIEDKIEFYRIMTDDPVAKTKSMRRQSTEDAWLSGGDFDALSLRQKQADQGGFFRTSTGPSDADRLGRQMTPRRQSTDESSLVDEFEALSKDLGKSARAVFFRMDTAPSA